MKKLLPDLMHTLKVELAEIIDDCLNVEYDKEKVSSMSPRFMAGAAELYHYFDGECWRRRRRRGRRYREGERGIGERGRMEGR